MCIDMCIDMCTDICIDMLPDPRFRTPQGCPASSIESVPVQMPRGELKLCRCRFAALVEKEWLNAGHMFAKRLGHVAGGTAEPKEVSPIFLQFLDTVFQLTLQVTL